VETRLTLLEQCKTPLRFWNYAFETLVYLINHMPTLILTNKSPFDCLFQRSLDYYFLRTFGCLYFSFMRPYHNHKLDFHSSPCVFFSYSLSHLSYRCFDIASQCIYISRHVRFHEHVFPFDRSKHIAQSSSPTSYQICYIPHCFTPLLIPSTTHVPLPPIAQLLLIRNILTYYLSHHHMHVYLTIML